MSRTASRRPKPSTSRWGRSTVGGGRGPNTAQAERWGGPAGRFWVEREADFDRQLQAYGDALLRAAALRPTELVLDVGCGTGTTTLAAARGAGEVLGVDLSPVMIDRARARGAEQPNARFEVADAQTTAFEARFDAVLSRFGLMFFDDPRAAFANLRRALVPGGRLVMVCWQALERNEWMRIPGEALAEVVPVGDLGEPGRPGPFALGSADVLTELLGGTGWADVELEGVAFDVPVGGAWTLDGAVEHVQHGSLGQSVLVGVSPEVERRALAAVRAALAPFATEDGVVLPSAGWLVRATNGISGTARRH